MSNTQQDMPEQAVALQQIIEKACNDREFRKRAIANPRAVLAEHGITLPEGHDIEFIECTPQKTYISLPAMLEQ